MVAYSHGLLRLFGGEVGYADVAYLARVPESDEVFHGAGDGPVGRRAVELVEVYVVGTEDAKTVFDGASHVVGGVVSAGELGGQEDIIPPALDGFADYGLAGLVALGGVYECHTNIERGPDCGDALFLRHGAESASDRPGAEGHYGYQGAVVPSSRFCMGLYLLCQVYLSGWIVLCAAIAQARRVGGSRGGRRGGTSGAASRRAVPRGPGVPVCRRGPCWRLTTVVFLRG